MPSNKHCLRVACIASMFLSLGITAAVAAVPDFNKVEDSSAAFLRLRCSLNARDQIYSWWTGTIYARIPGQVIKPIMGFEGYNVCRTVKKANGDYQLITREVTYYRDLKTGKIIEHWDNPYTGKTDAVMQVHNDPVNATMPAHGSTAYKMPWKVMGGDVMLLIDVPLSYPNALSPTAFPEESSGDQYIASEHFGFFAKLSDMNNPALDSVPYVNSWFRTGPWLPWMKMGQRPGDLIYSGEGKKLEHGFADLPADVQAYTREHFPKFVNAPASFVTPNETSWSVYKDTKQPEASSVTTAKPDKNTANTQP